jgi:putative ATPase
MIAPLAERMRPHTIEEYAGQQHLVGAQGALRPILNTGQLPSLIFWGPPGTGKTTLAMLMSKIIDRPFYSLSAINSGVKEVRDIIEKAKNSGGLFTQKGPLLFIDEIHRFSKSQQDSLLGAVEKGFVTLIGATTENPSFEVIKALLSRCQVYTLKPLLKEDLQELLKRALEKDEILKQKKVTLVEDQALLKLSGGVARKMLSLLELVVMSQEGKEIDITDEIVLEKAQTKTVLFDKNGDQHYDIISAFIKSIRGSDPNAAVYWLARLIEGGEDVKFIARRLLILASEDIGNANPTALVLANNTFQAVTAIGYPEARIILSQCVIYLATSPKSNASYLAISKAQEIVNEHGSLQVPLPLRNAASSLMKDLDYGKGYQYAHDYNLNFVNQEFLPEELSNTRIFEPGQNSKENAIRSFLKERWEDKYGY